MHRHHTTTVTTHFTSEPDHIPEHIGIFLRQNHPFLISTNPIAQHNTLAVREDRGRQIGQHAIVKQYLLRLLTDFTVIGIDKARMAMRFKE